MCRRHKVAIATNIISPYRAPIYEKIAEEFDVAIFISGRESNRDWNQEEAVGGSLVKRSWGVTLRRPNGRFLHLNPGLALDLVRYRPDAILSNEMGLRSLIALSYGALMRVPVWVWWGGTIHTEGAERSLVRSALRRKVFRCLAKGWIAYGQSSTEYLKHLGIDSSKILQLQNSIDERPFLRHQPPLELPLPHPRLLVVGQLIPRKGFSNLLQAVAEVQSEGYDFALVVVGRGPLEAELKRQVELLRIRHFHHIPSVPYEGMPAVYRACDALVFPTLEDVWGLVVNEAIMSGLPAIVSIFAGCAQELVPPEYQFDPLDRHQFTSKLRQLVSGRISPVDPSILIGSACNSERIVRTIRDRLEPVMVQSFVG